jgi:hypothetical protein
MDGEALEANILISKVEREGDSGRSTFGTRQRQSRNFDEETGPKPGVNDGNWGRHISMDAFILVCYTNLCNCTQLRCFKLLVHKVYCFAL